MINPSLKLNPKLFEKGNKKEATKEGWGKGLVSVGNADDRVVVLSADTATSVRNSYFQEKFPERFIQVGVSEQALATVASGMANYGKIPYMSTYAVFSPGRNWEQIRTTISLNNVPVKIGGAHTGVSVGADGSTHQALEDIALMRVIPNMVVLAPCDSIETEKAVISVLNNGKPSYVRFARDSTEILTTKETSFEIGKAHLFWQSKKPQVSIVACGPLVYEALLAAKDLDENGIESEVINCHTIKPIDEGTIVSAAIRTGAVVSVEDHQINGGLGSAISEVLARNYPAPMEFIGMHDSFGESGLPDELHKKYKMKSDDIVEAAKKVISRKKKI